MTINNTETGLLLCIRRLKVNSLKVSLYRDILQQEQKLDSLKHTR